MKDIQDLVFSDFEPPATTDGSYRGTKKQVDATKKHYDMKFEQELLKVNHRLKSSKTKVSIEATKGALQLRATLPLKPGETHPQGKDKKQYKISLGIPASFDGLKTAEEEAYELGRLIARKIFIWSDKYLGVQATKDKGITFKEFYEQFEKRYFETRKKTLKSENTFNNYAGQYKRFFLVDEVINQHNSVKIIQSINSPATRQKCIELVNIIKKILSLEIDVSACKLTQEKKKRNIPSDKEIINGINSFEKRFTCPKFKRSGYRENWKLYKIIYGLLATYGLRPREIINKPDLGWLVSPENKHNTFKVHESNKTGYREVFPFVPDWIELFDLKNLEFIAILEKYCNKWDNSKSLSSKVHMISNNFTYSHLKFTPYDLRHACAIRAHLQGVPVKAAADNLGHTVDMHTKVYQQWFGLENRRKAFEQTFESVNEVDALKDELAEARREIAELKAKLARYKLDQMM